MTLAMARELRDSVEIVVAELAHVPREWMQPRAQVELDKLRMLAVQAVWRCKSERVWWALHRQTLDSIPGNS